MVQYVIVSHSSSGSACQCIFTRIRGKRPVCNARSTKLKQEFCEDPRVKRMVFSFHRGKTPSLSYYSFHSSDPIFEFKLNRERHCSNIESFCLLTMQPLILLGTIHMLQSYNIQAGRNPFTFPLFLLPLPLFFFFSLDLPPSVAPRLLLSPVL